ncbi:MAG: DUF6328 family protein [Solirubrobacterales bacterium]
MTPSRAGKEAAKGSKAAPGRRETAFERADRNMGELLQELRIALPGVQVLFAFLLTVPFAQGFAQMTSEQVDLYFGVLLATAVSTAFLIAPTALHRLLFRQRDKEYLVALSNVLAIVGLLVLAVAITSAVLLIADFIFDGAKVTISTIAIGALLLTLWVAFPLGRRLVLRRGGKLD